jgi:uncharacterized membrane protein
MRLPISMLLFGAGAASMYLLDPQRGRRRRHILGDRLRSAVGDVEDVAGKAERDLENRARGAIARARGAAPSRRDHRSLLSEGVPERRLLEGGAGALLGLWGLSRGGVVGLGATIGGAYLVARAAVPRQDGVIRVQKTITIRAPIERVFSFWSQFANFPLFMEHVLAVHTIGDRSRWRVAGPLGITVEWEAEMIERVENRKIAWRSVEDSSITHHGEVHFEKTDDNATRISIHMAYDPPGGALGHAVAGFLMGDPKTLMDDDLLRLKSLLENGATRAHSRHVRSDQVH